MEFNRILQYQFPLLRGDDVRAVQQALTALNIVPSCGMPDGVFGAQTQATVRGFQQSWNLHLASGAASLDVDGKVGPASWAALFRAAGGAGATAPHVTAATGVVSPELAKEIPIDRARVGRLKTWMTANFKPQIDAAIADTPVTFDLVCAIAGKETAIYWIDFIDRITPENLLPVCVFDATGDFPGTESNRSAFPVNAAALRADSRFEPGLTDMLIAESNKMRHVLHGWGPAPYLYKGYGIFQYDLQNIQTDPAFFTNKLWYDFAHCINRLMLELREKLQQQNGDLTQAVRAYNGSGARAEIYVKTVMILRDWATAFG